MLQLERLAREVVTRWERGDLSEAVRDLNRHLQELAADRTESLDLIQRAIEVYAGDDIHLDAESAVLSRSDGGAFVLGWLWVADPHDDICAEALPPGAAIQDKGIRPG